MKKFIIFIAVQFLFLQIFAQNYPIATKAGNRLNGFMLRKQLNEKSLVKELKFRSVGPSIMSGRVTDIDVNPNNSNEFYVAYASGGLWKTINRGTTFTPVFDNEAVMTIGDIAVDWKNNETIWIGSGEVNSSRSSYAGNGVYKSTDKGKSWINTGLTETHHIGRLIIHPNDKNTVWVAALGHLYSTNPERGVFKSTDGGKNWQKTLFVNDSTGAVDLIIDPQNPNILYAATWQRNRKAWNFKGSGKGSGIYKSVDAGTTWQLISGKKFGFPKEDNVGRIGLDISPQNPNIIYALLDNQALRKDEKKKNDKDKLTKKQLKTISKDEFLKLDDKKIDAFLKENAFPKKHTAKSIKKKVSSNKLKPVALVEYLVDANADLFDSPPIGAELYRSDNGGESWVKTHEKYIDDVYYTYGYYFGVVRVSPFNVNEVYILGVPVLKSEDGGKTFKSLQKENVHGDHHVLWLSPKTKGFMLNGNDGGLNITYDDGENWLKANNPNVGQFYSVNYDLAKNYNVYGGLQDNGVWKGPADYEKSPAWHQNGQYPYKRLMGGDGMQVEIDTRDNETVYTGYQFGHYFRINQKTEDLKYFHPKHKLGERPLRFNWQTPIHLSKHNQDILYMGSNKFHRSMNKANSFETLSRDLTKGGKKGNVSYGTLTTIDESPLKFGLIYVGTDDGFIHRSDDGGNTWEKLSDALPQDLWVTRVTASKFKKSRVYASLNGYRWDDFNSYLYVSEDFGKNWTKIGTDLPSEPVNVIKEDEENENLLFVGTDNGLYASINRGESFMLMNKNLPAAPVHDLVIHPREKELIIGTHGRSLYIADISHLQQLNKENLNEKIIVFSIKPVKWNNGWGNSSWWKMSASIVETFGFAVYSNSNQQVNVKIKSNNDLVLKDFKSNLQKGLNYISYDLTFYKNKLKKYQDWLNENRKKDSKEIKLMIKDNDKYYLHKGKYIFEIEVSGKKYKEVFELKATSNN
ncbi:MAG: glycosyl hydrolase [Bacteroidetes bacterium 4572_117]|nr:MAG: glycosyl hydrolase [Bacteroidetes bacterium 4572_117]